MPALATPTNGQLAPFRPKPIATFEEAGLSQASVEALILKYLLQIGTASGRRIAEELGLPFGAFPNFFRNLKNNQIVAYANVAAAGDYDYFLTDTGRARARSYLDECGYVGTAPVSFEDYVKSVAAQTIAKEQPKEEDLRRAFSDLMVSDAMFAALGPAINSGRGMFLYGDPGNGKTSIAERVIRCFGTTVWIPLHHLGLRPGHQALRPGQPRGRRHPRPPASSATTTSTAGGSRSSGRP